MKKKILKTIGIVFAILLAIGGLGTLIFFNYVGDEKYTEGKYKIQNCSEYPDAYIEVKGDTIQFHNIDLNKLYREKTIEEYNKYVEMGSFEELPKEVFSRISDYNRAFVDNPWVMEYYEDNKTGTFTYINYCMIEDDWFGIVLHYDSFNKSIRMVRHGESYTFKK